MILKASQRGGGQDLAAHLMRVDDNEHVSLHELRGFAADDLKGAFKEAEAVSRGTKCNQYLFSLSLNPPEQEHVPVEVFETAIGRIEERLGLQGQPRAVVFHEKEGRRHAHCVWSRIEPETMTARQLSFFKTKLQGVARELYLENGWKLPRGLVNAAERDPTNFTLAEWQQAKRQQIDPRWLKSTLQECWQRSDNPASFQRALQERGFHLAQGDKRGFVVLDHQGEVWSLPRMLDLKTKDVRARLGSGELPSVEQTRATIGERMVPAINAHAAESRARFAERAATLGKYKAEMTELHREAREKLKTRQEAQWREETIQRAARLPRGIRGLWHRITGKYQQVRRENEVEAKQSRDYQAKERDALIAKQLEQRAVLQSHFKELRRGQAEELLALRSDIGRFLSFTRGTTARAQASSISTSLKLKR
jgi:hypothetical protein